MRSSTAETRNETPPLVVRDDAVVKCGFNVMNDRPVEETLHVKEYVVTPRRVEARFDRSYVSSMAKSPDHLIFLTALVHTQKMLYLALCQEFGFEYGPDEPEDFKMWPTKVDVKMPRLISENEDVVQVLEVTSLRKFDDKTWKAELETRVSDALFIWADVPVYLI